MNYDRYAYLFQCLANRSRLRLLELLAGYGEMSVSDIVSAFQGDGMDERETSTISRNLGILRQQGLVQVRREGQWKYYRLNAETIDEVCVEFKRFLMEAPSRFETD